MTTHLTRPAELLDLVGGQLATTAWYQITCERVNLFADATGDYRGRVLAVQRFEAGLEAVFGVTFESEEAALPVCVAEPVIVYR